MRYCNNCGEKIADDAKFCPTCGTKFADQAQQQQTYQPPAPEQANTTNEQQVPPQQPNYQQTYQQPNQQNAEYNPYDQMNNSFYQQSQADKPSGKLNTGMLVWSIINIIFCCMPLGVISLIMTITANSTTTAQEENKKLSTAKTLNLIGSIVGGIFTIIYIILIASGLLDLSTYY